MTVPGRIYVGDPAESGGGLAGLHVLLQAALRQGLDSAACGGAIPENSSFNPMAQQLLSGNQLSDEERLFLLEAEAAWKRRRKPEQDTEKT